MIAGTTQEQRKQAFLDAYRRSGRVKAAAAAAGIDRSTHYVWLRSDRDYFEAFAGLRSELLSLAEDAMWRRAVTGWLEPVYQRGEQVGRVRKFSDRLLVMLLRSLAPEKYNQPPRIMVQDSRPVVPIEERSDEELLAMIERVDAALSADSGNGDGEGNE